MIYLLDSIALAITVYIIFKFKLPIIDIIFLIIAPLFYFLLFLLIFTRGNFYLSIMIASSACLTMLPALVFFSISITSIYEKYSLSYTKLIVLTPFVAFASILCYIVPMQLIYTQRIHFNKLDLALIVATTTGTLSTALLYYLKRRQNAN